MEASKTTARLLPDPQNPLGERDIEVGVSGEGAELRPVVEVDGERHELRLVSFADGEGMPEYVYEHPVRDAGAPQGFGCP